MKIWLRPQLVSSHFQALPSPTSTATAHSSGGSSASSGCMSAQLRYVAPTVASITLKTGHSLAIRPSQ
jgi:hypothetical protein